MDDAPIRTEQLRKVFGDLVAVDGLDLEIRRGEFFGLLGANGPMVTTWGDTLEDAVAALVDKLDKEQATLAALLADPKKQRVRMKRDMAKIRDRYGLETVLGKRRTTIEEAAPTRDIPLEAMIERELDYLLMYHAPLIFADERAKAVLSGLRAEHLRQAIRLEDIRRHTLGDDSLVRGRIAYPEKVQIDETLFSLG